ncbi:MAG: hypothetical protein GC191_08175 [Azospirillum sp.]|nr:hypothetical protein [Azospirillum sp.]
MSRARGSLATLAAHSNASTYGTVPAAAGWNRLPFGSWDLSAEQPYEADDTLGFGRVPQEPNRGLVTAQGNVTVPVDVRNIGFWLKHLFGTLVTTGVPATGSFTFSANPADGATLTLNGVDWTFQDASPTHGETLIGGDLATTLASLAADLNGSSDTEISKCSYSASATVLTVTYKMPGTGGNAFTLAASSSPASNATPSAGTLTGGSGSPPYVHTFTPVANANPPDFAVEVGHPEVPRYFVCNGVMVNTLALTWGATQAKTAAQLGLMAQGEADYATSQAGTLTKLNMVRFNNFQGSISSGGNPLAEIESCSLTLDNSLDPDRVIRNDGRINGIDAGMMKASGSMVAKFASMDLYNTAAAGDPIDLSLKFTRSASQSLEVIIPAVYLPRTKRPIANEKAIRQTFNWMSADPGDSSPHVSAVLKNDVASY